MAFLVLQTRLILGKFVFNIVILYHIHYKWPLVKRGFMEFRHTIQGALLFHERDFIAILAIQGIIFAVPGLWILEYQLVFNTFWRSHTFR